MDMLAVLFSFSGRIGRGQYWLGYFVQLALVALSWMCLLTGQQNENILLLVIPIIIAPIVLWMALAIMAKRYHDRDKQAWWILIAFIPIVGPIWQLIELGLLRGTDGANDYGPDPCHSFDVTGDVETLHQQASYQPGASAGTIAKPGGAVSFPRSRSPYTDGRPVFGKRV